LRSAVFINRKSEILIIEYEATSAETVTESVKAIAFLERLCYNSSC
jgi:hypothetical protein